MMIMIMIKIKSKSMSMSMSKSKSESFGLVTRILQNYSPNVAHRHRTS